MSGGEIMFVFHFGCAFVGFVWDDWSVHAKLLLNT